MTTELRVWRLCEHGKSYVHMYQVDGHKLSCRTASQTLASVADLVAALIAEGGEILPTWKVDPTGSFPFWIGVEQPGRYLVFPIPVESAEAKETP